VLRVNIDGLPAILTLTLTCMYWLELMI